MFIRALVLLVALVPATLLAGTRDPNTPDSQYVEFGKKFTSVRRIRAVIRYNEKDTYQYGSAVIIQPHWALTAAHVLEGATGPEILNDDDTKYPLSHVVVHHDYQHANIGYHDIALVYSPKDFALQFYTPLYTDHDEVGKAVTIAGYGFHGTFHTGMRENDGRKRAGHNKIESTEKAVLICTPSQTGKFPLEFIITPGDSGGGLFIGDKLAGINSFLSAVDKKPDGTYGDEAAHTRISLYADWVNTTIAQYELALQARATLSNDVRQGE